MRSPRTRGGPHGRAASLATAFFGGAVAGAVGAFVFARRGPHTTSPAATRAAGQIGGTGDPLGVALILPQIAASAPIGVRGLSPVTVARELSDSIAPSGVASIDGLLARCPAPSDIERIRSQVRIVVASRAVLDDERPGCGDLSSAAQRLYLGMMALDLVRFRTPTGPSSVFQDMRRAAVQLTIADEAAPPRFVGDAIVSASPLLSSAPISWSSSRDGLFYWLSRWSGAAYRAMGGDEAEGVAKFADICASSSMLSEEQRRQASEYAASLRG